MGMRLGKRALGMAAVGLACAAVGGGWMHARAADREQARARAAADLAALQRCLAGEPLRPGEALGARLRGVELAIALARMAREEQLQTDGGAPADVDAGAAPAEPQWPKRCAPFAESLAQHLDEAGDPRLDALRDALPTSARFAMPYALMADEAAELATGIEKAGLPAKSADNEPPPPALAAPLATAGVTPLGKGRIRMGERNGRTLGTDVLATSTMHLLVHDVRPRICALDPDGPAGPYGLARCGELAKGITPVSFPILDDGAPLAVHATKEIPPKDGRSTASGILVLAPGGPKAIPINGPVNAYSAYLSGDGAYIIPAYAPLVRLGKIAALTTDDLAAPSGGDRTVSALTSATADAFAAYGMVFANDRPPIYTSFDPERRFWGRRVDPVFEPKETDLGQATANYGLTALGGCRTGARRALLFATDTPKKARVVLVDGDGPLRGIDAVTGTTAPHLHCGRDAVFVTSVEPVEPHGSVVVVETRCAGTACEAKRSAPIALPAAAGADAATFDGGVVLTWITRADQVTTAARGMAFYKVAALDALAAAPPHPIFEGARRGGIDFVRAWLVPRPKAAIVALETGGKEPVTYAARIDARGAVAAVRMEETKW